MDRSWVTAELSSSSWPPPRPTTRATRSVSDPGPETRSATLEIMAVGMLSITNQPRSSKLAAACERPAPDRPVMIRNSATLSIVAAGRADEAHTGSFSARRNKRRGMLAAWAYSRARSRNPGGGAGSSMRVMWRPAATMALT